MEFHIPLASGMPDVELIREAIETVDPSALVDIDPAGPTLRVSAALDACELTSLISGTGHAVSLEQITQLPSTCCGGCGG